MFTQYPEINPVYTISGNQSCLHNIWKSVVFKQHPGDQWTVLTLHPRYQSIVFTQDLGYQSVVFTQDLGYHTIVFTQDLGYQSVVFTQDLEYQSIVFTQDLGYQSIVLKQHPGYPSVLFTRHKGYQSAVFGNSSVPIICVYITSGILGWSLTLTWIRQPTSRRDQVLLLLELSQVTNPECWRSCCGHNECWCS